MGENIRSDDAHNAKEGKFDRALELTIQLNGFDGFQFNPVTLVKSVNLFHSLGSKLSIELLQRLDDDGANPENVLLVARALFLPQTSQEPLPDLVLGKSDIDKHEDLAFWPLFPLHLVHDIPLMLVGGYLVGGEGPASRGYLDWCADQGRLRPDPLRPGDKPLAEVDHFISTSMWQKHGGSTYHTGMLRIQALRCLPGSFQPNDDQRQALLASTKPTDFWLNQRKREKQLQVYWSSRKTAYQAGN